MGRIDGSASVKEIYEQDPFKAPKNRCHHFAGWQPRICTASLPPRNSSCQNFTCIFDSVDSPYCARNLRQISLGPTFSLVRNFITTHCAIVIGTSFSLILNSTNWGEGRVWQRGEEGPHHTAAQGHYPIVLIHWLQLTEVSLYLIYLCITAVVSTNW